jgi:polysaccharide export outer membrane protein
MYVPLCSAAAAEDGGYLIKSSDVLSLSVWKEDGLQVEAVVRPDGRVSFPLVGELDARGRTIEQVRLDLVGKLDKFIPDPVVTVALLQSIGNRIFVIGKVNKPGVFPLAQDMDVMQALSLGGGLATFASDSKITILRRIDGSQSAIPFDYGEVEYGRNLEQNILLEPGDVVVVP